MFIIYWFNNMYIYVHGLWRWSSFFGLVYYGLWFVKFVFPAIWHRIIFKYRRASKTSLLLCPAYRLAMTIWRYSVESYSIIRVSYCYCIVYTHDREPRFVIRWLVARWPRRLGNGVNGENDDDYLGVCVFYISTST